MEIAWGDGLGEETKGLDILGIRALDQSLEAALANGITTISLRGRYFTILPWLIGEFSEADRKAGVEEFDEKKLKSFIGRVEYLTLACTVTDDSRGDAGGALGLNLFREAMSALRSGEAILYPKDRKGSMLGTYFGPCRALGILKTAERTAPQPFSLTPRGQEIWMARNKAIAEAPIRHLIWESDHLTPEDVELARPHFSLMRLAAADEEAACLREALSIPWAPIGGGDAISLAYERFTSSLAWLRAQATSGSLRAGSLLAHNYRQIVDAGRTDGTIQTAWAEFEWRRRLHFALELMLSAVSREINEKGQATLNEIVTQWSTEPELPPVLIKAWPDAQKAWDRSGAEVVDSVPKDFFINRSPVDALGGLSPHAGAVAAYGVLAGQAAQSKSLREGGDFSDHGRLGEKVIQLVEPARDEPFGESLQRLANLVVEAHLANTFRKMAAGQKCSLRFFPDGEQLRATGIITKPGQSGSRLDNIIRVTADAGVDGIAHS